MNVQSTFAFFVYMKKKKSGREGLINIMAFMSNLKVVSFRKKTNMDDF